MSNSTLNALAAANPLVQLALLMWVHAAAAACTPY